MASIPRNTPISIGKVAQVLGSTSGDLGTLCTDVERINRWARFKPVHYPKLDRLTPAETIGCEQSYGRYFGLQAAPTASRLALLHDCTYAYVGAPRGTSGSPYRLSDFMGYDHEARPDLYGYMTNGATLRRSAVTLGLHVSLQDIAAGTSSPGIRLEELVGVVAGGLGSYYPCVLVDDYACALLNSRTYPYIPTPIDYNEARWQDFHVKMPSSLASVGEHRVSFFLSQHLSQQALYDFNEWRRYPDNVTIGETPIAIPGASGLAVTITQDVVSFATVVGVLLRTNSANITIHVNTDEPMPYRWRLQIGAAYTGGTAIAVGEGPRFIKVGLDELNIMQLNVGSTVPVTVQLSDLNGNILDTWTNNCLIIG